MSRVCQVTGKKPMKGHYVSHAHNKTIRTFEPNLHYRRFWGESTRYQTIVIDEPCRYEVRPQCRFVEWCVVLSNSLQHFAFDHMSGL